MYTVRTVFALALIASALFWSVWSHPAQGAPAGKGDLQHPYPLWPSEPVPGWPGVGVDENTTVEKLTVTDKAGNVIPAVYGLPEFLAYPGAVHHDRNEWQRYVPSCPVYNHRTLVKNFVLKDIQPYAAKCVDFAEPVYYNPMYGPRVPTTKKRAPVKAWPWRRGGEPIRLEIGRLKPGLYCIRAIYAAPGVSTVVPKKYVFIELRINDLPSDPEKPNACILRAQTLDNFYAGQEFYFHAAGDRLFRAELYLLPESDIDLLVHNVDVHDRFGEVARRKGKTRSTLFDTSERKTRWERLRKDAAFRSQELVAAEEQKKRDDAAWTRGWPLNVHIGGDSSRYVMCLAPEEWKRYDWALRCKDGNFYIGHRQGRWGIHAYNEPARYAFKGGKAVVRVTADDGAAREEVLGPAEPGMRFDASSKILYKGEKQLRTNVLDAWVVDAEVFDNGKPLGKSQQKLYLRWFDPGKTYFDKAGYEPQDRIIEMGTPARGKLFYNATRMRDLPHGRGITRTGGSKGSQSQWERDRAMEFIEGVYRWPSIQTKHNLTYMIAGAVTGARGRPHGLDREWHRRYGWGVRGQALLEGYDQLFPVIDGNEELAQAVGRYIPWVKMPDDVIRLIDTYLVQDNANDIMHYRYYYDHSMHLLMMKAVVVQDDPKITEPWMEFLWTRMWEYPQALSGMPDNIVTGATRDGGTTIGSFNYTRYPRHMELIDRIQTYLRNGGLKKYDIADPDRYRKVFLSPYFVTEAAAAGRHTPGVGDVGGPTQAYGGRLEAGTRPLFSYGWRWHHDPKFACELVHTFGRAGESDAEWAEIVKAASGQRDPYLQNRSRILADWNGYLDGGQDENDFRFRRALAVRVGNGWGHNHWDTLDLRLWAHGIVMSGDAGQRSAYGQPNHRRSRVHNVMEVDGRDWYSHSWIADLFDAPGAHYLRAESVAPYTMEQVTLFQRQCALIDVDPGVGSKKEAPRLDPDVVTPSSYVFDVFRGAGGKTYTYCFHGAVDDQFEVNVKERKNLTGEGDDPDEAYMREFTYRKIAAEAGKAGKPDPNDVEWAADPADNILQATWRVARWKDHRNNPEAKMHSGKHGGAMTAPRKFTRLHLFDAGGSRVLHGICQDRVRWNEHNPAKKNYAVRCLFAQRRGSKPSDTVFVALMEPYAGQPFISGRRLLKIDGNETDARRAVAIEVQTTNGHSDIIFADGRPGALRKVEGGLEIAAEYALLSRDEAGLRLATLHHGRCLRSPEINIEVAQPAYGGTVSEIDYIERRVVVNGSAPAYLAGHFFEAGGDYHRTSCQVSRIEPAARKGTAMWLRKGLEIMRTRVRDVDPDTATVLGAVAMIRVRGRDRGLVASTDDLKRFWRVEYAGGNRHSGHVFKLSHLDPGAKGPAFAREDFPPGSGLSVWEFGVGDRMLIRTGVSLRRLGKEDVYGVYTTVPFQVSMPGRGFQISTDRKAWTDVRVKQDGARAVAAIPEDVLAGTKGRFFLRPVR